MNKIKLFTFLLILLFLSANASATQYYVNNTCTFNGTGLTTDCAASDGADGAFHSLDDADGKAGGYAAGDIISLKRGQTYYETFTVPSSGSAGNPITINSYGTGNKPIITGEFKDPSWSTYDDGRAGTNVFVANIGAVDPVYVWRTTASGDTFKMQENTTSADVLEDLEWYYSNPNIYVRDDSGTSAPTDAIRAPVRATNISASSKTYITLDGLSLLFTTSCPFQALTSSEGVVVQNCELAYGSQYLVNLGAVNGTVFKRNLFHDYPHTSYVMNVALGTSAEHTFTAQDNVFYALSGTGLQFSNAVGGANIYNNTFVGFGGTIINNSSTSNTLNNKNNIYTASGSGSSANIIRQSTGATHNFTNNVILAHGRDTTKTIDATVTDGGGNIWDAAKLSYPERYGVLVVSEDNIFGGADELIPIAAVRNIPLTYYVSGVEYSTASWDAAFIAKAKQWITDGKVEIGSHSKTHIPFIYMTGINIQYVGAGAAATMTIASNSLVTTVDGSGDLNIDLTNDSYDTCTELCTYIDADSDYTCTLSSAGAIASANLADISAQDIKTGVYASVFDATRYAAAEVTASKTKLDADLAPHAVTSFAYPGTSPAANSAIVTAVAATDFTSARTVGNTTYWNTATGIDLYHWDNLSVPTGQTTYYAFNDALTDSVSSLTFTGTDVAYSADRVYSAKSASLNGTTSKLIRADSASWDFSEGDWAITLQTKPTGFAAKQVLYSQATDADNYMEIYIDTSGYVHLDIYAAGSPTLELAQSANALSTSNWNRVTVYEAVNRFKIYTSTYDGSTFSTPLLVASTTSTARPANYTQNAVFGAFTADNSTYSGFYGGLIDSVSTAKYPWRKSMAVFENLAANGLVTSTLSHAESGMSRGLYIPFMDALTEFNGTNSATSGRVRVMTAAQMTSWLTANGRAVTDVRGGTDKWRYDIPRRTVDLDELHYNSPAIYGGTDLSLTGGDRLGVPLRDSAHPTIGSREKYQKIF